VIAHEQTRPPGADVRAPVMAATLALAAACWVVAVRRMDGMDMGAETQLGPLASFMATWVVMMAAMMLPAAVPAVLDRVRVDGRLAAAPLFVGSYLAVWAVVGLVVVALYRPHGPLAAGALTIAAGVYELTPLKRTFRRRCRERAGSGFAFAIACVGSSAGLTLVLLALGAMSVTWMALIAAVVLAQKLLPPAPSIDVPLALAIVAVGVAHTM
jgi:predicted metal-binding membrane protein